MKDFSKIRQLVAVIITIAELAGFDAIAQTPQSLPRISISDFEYQGAFRLPAEHSMLIQVSSTLLCKEQILSRGSMQIHRW